MEEQAVLEQSVNVEELQKDLEKSYQTIRRLNSTIKNLEHKIKKYDTIVEKANRIIQAVKTAGSFCNKEEIANKEAWARIDARSASSDS